MRHISTGAGGEGRGRGRGLIRAKTQTKQLQDVLHTHKARNTLSASSTDNPSRVCYFWVMFVLGSLIDHVRLLLVRQDTELTQNHSDYRITPKLHRDRSKERCQTRDAVHASFIDKVSKSSGAAE